MDRVASIARALAPAEPAAAPAPASAAEAEGPPQIDLEGGSADNWAVLVDVDEDGGLGRSVKAIRHGADADQHESSITMVEGVAMPGFCDQGRWDSLRGKLKGALRPDDVVVSTYPKCGTTWTEQVCLLLMHDGDTSVLNPATKNSFNAETKIGKIWLEPMIDSGGGGPGARRSGPPGGGGEFQNIALDDFLALPSPRLIKTHNAVKLFVGGDNADGSGTGNPCGGARVVYVSRNPKDACVSSYYHAFNPFTSGWPFDAWASVWLQGHVSFGDWFAVTKAWYELAQQSDNVLFVRFEDMKADPAKTIRRIAEHIGAPTDDDLIDRVVVGSTFRAMADLAKEKNDGKDVGHLRKGDVGDWRNHFSPTLSAQFDAEYARQFAGTGLEYDLGEGETLRA